MKRWFYSYEQGDYTDLEHPRVRICMYGIGRLVTMYGHYTTLVVI